MNNGKMECVPKCDLGSCDSATGVCNSGFAGSSGKSFLPSVSLQHLSQAS